MEEIVDIHVKLRHTVSNEPITGDEFQVNFYDKDLLKDDFLGTSTLDDQGHAVVSVTRTDYRSPETPFEKKPDIYFEVHRNGEVLYKSPVSANVDLEERNDFPVSGGKHCDLGTYNILL